MNSAKETELSELLSLLGEDVAQAVRAHLPDASRAAISQLSPADAVGVSGKRRARLLGEFERFLQFILTQSTQERPSKDAVVEETDPEQPQEELGDDPLGVLRRVSPERFALSVRGEHPRTI